MKYIVGVSRRRIRFESDRSKLHKLTIIFKMIAFM